MPFVFKATQRSICNFQHRGSPNRHEGDVAFTTLFMIYSCSVSYSIMLVLSLFFILILDLTRNGNATVRLRRASLTAALVSEGGPIRSSAALRRSIPEETIGPTLLKIHHDSTLGLIHD